jgi:hypothetical protein
MTCGCPGSSGVLYRVYPTSASARDQQPLRGVARVLWGLAADAPLDDDRRERARRSAQRFYLLHCRSSVGERGLPPTEHVRRLVHVCRDGSTFGLAWWKVATALGRRALPRVDNELCGPIVAEYIGRPTGTAPGDVAPFAMSLSELAWAAGARSIDCGAYQLGKDGSRVEVTGSVAAAPGL